MSRSRWVARVGRLATGAALLLLPSAAGTARAAEEPPLRAPELIVERITAVGERQVRVSLFNNRVAVSSVSERGVQVDVRRVHLDDETYIAYLAAVNHDAEAAVAAATVAAIDDPERFAVLRVLVPAVGVQEVAYPRSALFELPLARLSALLDDLETIIATTPESSEEIAGWQPHVGDLVELAAGGRARVVDVRDDGLVVLEHEEVALVEMVTPDRLATVVRRVVEAAP